MDQVAEFRCEMTSDFLDQVEPQLRAVLLARHDHVVPALRARRRHVAAAARLVGLACAAVGIGLAGYGIAVTSDTPCTRGRLIEYHLAVVAYVLLGTLIWFLPRLTGTWAARLRDLTARRVPSMLAPLRRRTPYTVEYTIAGGRLETRAPKLRLVRRTDLGAIRAAVVARQVACLYGRFDSTWLRRVVYLPDAGARRLLIEALRAAGGEVTELTGPAGG